MGKGTSKSVAAIARCRSLKIVDVMGARGAQIPSIVIVAMVVILVHEEQTMRRGHPPFPAVLAPPWYSLYDGDEADQTPALISLAASQRRGPSDTQMAP